jgi:flagellar assembly factor FliW
MRTAKSPNSSAANSSAANSSASNSSGSNHSNAEEEPMSVATLENTETVTLPVIDFVAPMPGFPDDTHFVLVRLDETGIVFSLKSVDSPGLRFLVVPPAVFFPDYAPEIDDETLLGLAVRDPKNLLVLLVIATGATADEATANLMAPIILNQETRRAVQLVLSGTGLPVRAPLLANLE